MITDPVGNEGFPGFDGMSATRSLSFVAAMQEHGIPVTFAYISDAHDLHPPDPKNDGYGHIAQGPGEIGYVQQLADYDRAFAKFFDRLESDGITPANTLFVFTEEEGDHFAGGTPANPGCDGVNTPCEFAHVICDHDCPSNDVGEINVNLRGLLATQRSNTTPFDLHSDMAPAFYLIGNPERGDPLTRTFERDVAALSAANPYTGDPEPVSDKMIDRVGMSLLHMVTADPLRTPTFVSFLDPDYFGFGGAPDCNSPCVQVQPLFAWNHGGIAPEIATTWVGFAGPGVRRLGDNGAIWMVGKVGMAGIDVSTRALEGDDATYEQLEDALADPTADRDAIAAQMRDMLEAAAFAGQPIDEQQAKKLIKEGEKLIERAEKLAGG